MTPQTQTTTRARGTVRTCKEVNQDFSASGQVPPLFQTHYYNKRTGSKGVRGLIKDVLKDNGSVWLGGIDSPQDRTDAIATGMYTDDIHDQAKVWFTERTTRYPRQSIKNYLVEMRKKGEIGKIKLSPSEDAQRISDRPRCKWYWALA
jgi:hypothetical protein